MKHYNPVLLPKVRSSAIMAAGRGMPCTLRVSSFMPMWKCADDATVVMCHLPSAGKGTSTKSSDLYVAAGCAHCHAIIDMQDINAWTYITTNYPTAYSERLLRGMQETLALLVQRGLVVVPDGEIVE